MRDRSMRSATELTREIKLTDWSTAGNLSNRSSGVQIPRDICTRLKRYLYSAKSSWIINTDTPKIQLHLSPQRGGGGPAYERGGDAQSINQSINFI